MVMYSWVLCNSVGQGVTTLTKVNLISLLAPFQLQCMLKCCSSDLQAFVPYHLHLFSIIILNPSILSYAMWLDPIFVAPSLVSNSPTLLRLRNQCLLSRCVYCCY